MRGRRAVGYPGARFASAAHCAIPLQGIALTVQVGRLALLGMLGLALGDGPGIGSLRPAAVPNNNRSPAGRLRHDTLTVRLVVGMASWTPEGDDGVAITVAAFGEQGKAPRIPGPLLRAPAGTVIDASVRNDLPDSTITVRGLVTHPGTQPDSLVIPPRQTARVRFPTGAPGTYLYYAEVGRPDTLVEREQLAGALVVDSAGARADDRIFVINIWGEPLDSVRYRNALAINGRSFPYDERVEPQVGDTLRWRWINASLRNHPMHLHGFYFRVDSKGDGLADTVYAPSARRMAVTENLAPRETMSLAWSPDRPGNWLFHCHIMFHVLDDARLGPPPSGPHGNHLGRHMAGLVLGISVRPGPGWNNPPRDRPRTLRLFVQEGRPRRHSPRAMGFVLQRDREPQADSVEIPGGVLVLTRGEPTDVVVINRLHEPTAVHWHGLELESWSDGVAAWSGAGNRVAPEIQPGDSFTARLTLRRAGTFIYHTHLDDFEQLTSGLYGAIVVLEPGRRFDPATDHVYVVGWDGPGDPADYVVNGDTIAPPLELAAGVTHRFRFVNIGMAGRVIFSLTADSALAVWQPVAKDGADLPPDQAHPAPATRLLAVGETFDALFLPAAPGAYRLTASPPGGAAFWTQAVTAR
jgi:FtsP/CotA-like multicopper oxidase with cupredoxin domain